MSYATLQRGITHFRKHDGYIAFVKTSYGNLVLGDPIISSNKHHLIITDFLKSFPNSHFFYISSYTKKHLQTFNYNAYKLGDEHLVNLKTFKGTWSSHHSLRSGYNRYKEKLSFIESKLEDQNIQEVKSLHNTWLQSKNHKNNMTFMIRPFTNYSETDCRYFFSFFEDTLVAVLRLTPTYNTLNDYYCDAFFSNPTFKSIKDYMIMSVIKSLQNEGADNLNLGLSPFSNINLNSKSKLTDIIFKIISSINYPKYGYKGIENYQKKFHGTKTVKFISTKYKFTIPLLWKTWKKMSS